MILGEAELDASPLARLGVGLAEEDEAAGRLLGVETVMVVGCLSVSVMDEQLTECTVAISAACIATSMMVQGVE